MEDTTKNATSGENQKVESESKDTSAKKENIVSPEKEEVNLTDEQWEQVFRHPRFAKLNEEAKEARAELAKMKKKTDQELQEKLKEEGKYKELLEAKEKELSQLTESLSEYKLNNAVITIANSLNVVDTDAVVKLIDRSKLETDKNGDYLNVDIVVKELLSQKPYLAKAGTNVSSNIGSNANATTESQSGDFVITKSN